MAKAYRPTSSSKRIPVEADNEEQIPIATTSAFQGSVGVEVTTKTWQDLPTELMEDILMKAVVAEVRDRNEAKSAWKQEARSVISRLSKVCSRWSEILTTKRFLLTLQRHLGPSPLHLEVVAKHRIDSAVAVATLNNEIFVLCYDETNALYDRAFVNVFDRNDLSKVKHVIQLGIDESGKPTDITTFSRMNHLFVMSDCYPYIDGIDKSDEHEYWTFEWDYLQLPTATPKLAMSTKENLVVTATDVPRFIQEYKMKSKGFLQFEVKQRVVRLPEDILSMSKAIQKSNGNFVFQSVQSDHVRRLLEIDAGGNIVQQRRLPLCDVPCYAVDMYNRIMIAGPRNYVRMLDDQFQKIQVCAPGDLWNNPSGLHYDEEANEWLLIDDGKYLTVVSIKEGTPTHDDSTDFA